MTGPPQDDLAPPRIPGERPPKGSGPDIILLILEILLGTFLVFALIVTPIAALIFGTVDAEPDAEAMPVTALSIMLSLIVFQAIQGAYPWLVEFRRGRTLEDRLRFESNLPADIGIGLILSIFCFIGAQIATFGISALVGLEDSNTASNTDILEDNQDSWLLIAVIFFVVVGAPLVEELLFRGLILRNLQRWFGSVFAIVGSSVLFAIPHWQSDATWQETTVLLSALGVVGLVLAIGAVITNRLGPAVIAHFFFNATGTIITLVL